MLNRTLTSRALTLLIVAVSIISVLAVNPSSAQAHGIGGIEPSSTTANVVSVTPKTSSFTAQSVENGNRLKITRTSNRSVIVLGVDDEPYILLDAQGVFINNKSATRLINKSTNASISGVELQKQFENTSIDPNETPDWEKVSSENFYIFHDHRAHYMGSVPVGKQELGTNEVAIRVGDTVHRVTLEFRSSKISFPYAPLIFLIVGVIAIAMLIFAFKNKFKTAINQKTFIALTFAIGVLEIIHVIGYMHFAHESFMQEISSSIYGIAIIALCIICIYKAKVTKNNTWQSVSKVRSPLFSATGFIALAAGSLTEYKSLFEPYLTTTLPSALARLFVILIGFFSTIILGYGLLYIKSYPSTSERLKVSQDSSAST